MSGISDPTFDRVRNYIRAARNNGIDWGNQEFFPKDTDMNYLDSFLTEKKQRDFWPMQLGVNKWVEILRSESIAEERSNDIGNIEGPIVVAGGGVVNTTTPPETEDSLWVNYLKHLRESGFSEDSIYDISSSTQKIVKHISTDTTASGPVKGLTVGFVQSGKTANIAALMSYAADWGWNFFIILTGTIENLRMQTEMRLLNDLRSIGKLKWELINKPSSRSHISERSSHKDFSDKSKSRYFTVCLKNKRRLSDLINWLQKDISKAKQLKIIVIDDESDQGGINTANVFKEEEERKTINKLIVNLVSSKKIDGNQGVTYKAMNYIGYTATPYANFLNEAGRESLYPKDFIVSLPPSKEYLGPFEIFGNVESNNPDGLDIVREVPSTDCELLKNIQIGETTELPESLKDALAWFMISVSSMRVLGFKTPISMLVHTSQRKEHHEHVAEGIKIYLSNTQETEITARIKRAYNKETNIFTKPDFLNQIYEYGRPAELIPDYPALEELWAEIEVLRRTILPIMLGDEGELSFHSGIHLCIDNSDKNGFDEDGYHLRLAYPDKELKPYPSPAPAFIVVGGTTISRGLTLEGLACSYFLRSSNQADTLMQMGRWFGYRRGYEIFPRIWMTKLTLEKFKFLTELEYDLRKDLRRYMDLEVDPSQFGPRVMRSPKVTWLRITAANRMQGSMDTFIDFSGTNNQTVVFHKEAEILSANLSVTENFINSLGSPDNSTNSFAVVWRNVDFVKISEEFLKKMKFHPRGRVFNQVEGFCKWYIESSDEMGFSNWNVVVSGVNPENRKSWNVGGRSIGLINRSRQKNSLTDSISIGVLRAPNDLVADAKFKIKASSRNLNWSHEREKAGLESTPQLLIYRIDKCSKASITDMEGSSKPSKSQRIDLNAPEDIIGVSIWIPSDNHLESSTSHAKFVTINLDAFGKESDSDFEGQI